MALKMKTTIKVKTPTKKKTNPKDLSDSVTLQERRKILSEASGIG